MENTGKNSMVEKTVKVKMLYYDFDESEWEKVKRNIKKIKIRYCDANMKGE